MSAYLFVHFKEKRTPDGEQVYFGISKDGFKWESVNDGFPVLWSYEGDMGVRDFTITRTKDNEFVILATDLSLAYGLPYKYKNSWDNITHGGSKDLVMWHSKDLVNWDNQKMLHVGDENFGCVWAPDIIYDEKNDDYVIHWSSRHAENDYGAMGIYYCRTRDFEVFSKPAVLFRRDDDQSVIDSAMVKSNGKYYTFIKNECPTGHIMLLESDEITGPYRRIDKFDEAMADLEPSRYEAPCAFKTPDGKWALMIDHYGCPEEEQGYIPYLADDIATGDFRRSDADFSFPYGYKHGTVLEITDEEYDRLKAYKKPLSER